MGYKQSHYIIVIPFTDGEMKAHGSGTLIDYLNHKIYRLTYKKGVLANKILHLDKEDNHDVFTDNKATKMIGFKHEQAFSLNF